MIRVPRRFWSKVDVGEIDRCWEWLAGKYSNGYGSFWVRSRSWTAHRVAWILTYGPIPQGLYVCHHCDNKGCCNPYHLFLGTSSDNLRDASKKGLIGRGEGNGSSKLTEEDVHKIRMLLTEGDLTLSEIAEEFGVWSSHISRIRSGKSWSWLE